MGNSLFIVAKERGRRMPTRVNREKRGVCSHSQKKHKSKRHGLRLRMKENQDHIFSLIHKIVSSEK